MKGKVVIIGAGVIGLSLAFELTNRNWQVTILERPGNAKNASWAGAGILLSFNLSRCVHPLDRLCALSNVIHREWSRRLLAETGIDNGLQICGGLYLARSIGEIAALCGQEQLWRDDEIEFESLKLVELNQAFPFLSTENIKRAAWIPGEGQIRNPRHLAALRKALDSRGTKFLQMANEPIAKVENAQVTSLSVDGHELGFDHLCVCAGAWSEAFVHGMGVYLPTTPVRGQMLLYKFSNKPFPFIVNEGPRYIVPRDDGHVLVGSTVEEVGFDTSTTDSALDDLKSFASEVCPIFEETEPINFWAGLRPASYDGLPYLGWIPGFSNALIATGHFRVGLQASPGTATIIADLIEQIEPPIDISAFRPSRVSQS